VNNDILFWVSNLTVTSIALCCCVLPCVNQCRGTEPESQLQWELERI